MVNDDEFYATDERIRAVFDGDEHLTTTEVADRVDADVTPQEVTVALNNHIDIVKVRDGSTLRWRLADAKRSHVACPLDCGFRPETMRGAAAHLCAHLVGRHTTGADQQVRSG